MSIWEAILYGVFGGLASLLPVSFEGHRVLLEGVFNFPSLYAASGYYVRAAICLGVMLAIFFSFSGETAAVGLELGRMTGLKRSKRGTGNILLRRSILLGIFALIPMLCSFFLAGLAAKLTSLLITAFLFWGNGLCIALSWKSRMRNKQEKETTMVDSLLIGLARGISIFPGLSSLGSSLCVGRARGLAPHYNLRFAYLLTLFYQGAAFVYFLIRAIVQGSFSASVLLPMLFGLLAAAVFGYLAIWCLRYLFKREKFSFFAYYCWTLGGILLVLSLINA